MSRETLGTRREHFAAGSVWYRARLLDVDGLRVGIAAPDGASRVGVEEVRVVSVGEFYATITTDGRWRDRVASRDLGRLDLRATPEAAVERLRERLAAVVEHMREEVAATERALALVSTRGVRS